MNAEVFIDTNVFLYSLSDRPEEQAKAERARQLLLTENWGWSVQVVGEFYYVATSAKRQFQLPHSSAMEYVETLAQIPNCLASSVYSTKRFAIEGSLSSELLGCGDHSGRSRSRLWHNLLRGS